MSLHRISDINSLDDPIKMFMLRFNIVLPSEVSNILDAEQLELRAQSFSMPTIKIDDTTVNWGGHERKYAGKQTRSGDWTVQFTEVWNGNVIRAFNKWMQLCHNYQEGTINLHDAYMQTINVNMLDPDLKSVRQKLVLKWAYPTNVALGGTIDASSSSPVNIDVTFHYNYFLVGDETDTQSE